MQSSLIPKLTDLIFEVGGGGGGGEGRRGNGEEFFHRGEGYFGGFSGALDMEKRVGEIGGERVRELRRDKEGERGEERCVLGNQSNVVM